MEDIIREYFRNNRQEMKKLKNENTGKEKKHLTYKEIKKIIETGKEIKSNENKPIENTSNLPQSKGKKPKKQLKKYNFDIT